MATNKIHSKGHQSSFTKGLISLEEYIMKIEYIKGKHNKVANFLSRINVERNEITPTEAKNLNPCLQ